MRILAVADIHGAIEVYRWLPGAVLDYHADVLILAGDLLIGGWEEEQSEHARMIVMPSLQAVPVPIFFIMGNDDHIELQYENERIRSVHGRRLDFGAYGIAGYQFSPPFMGGCHEKPEDEIAADLCTIEPLLDKNTILVTHTPAFGNVDRIYSGYQVGSHALAGMLDRVNIACHIHGHIHHSFGRAGIHFNVAAGGRCRAMIIELPSLSHNVIQATVEQKERNVT